MAVTPSARSLNYSRPAVLMQENYPDVLNSRMKEVKRRLWKIPLEWRNYWNEQSTQRSSESYSFISSGGVVPKARDVDPIPQMQLAPGYNNTITPEEFKLGISIGRRLRETDQFGVIDKHFMDLNNAMIRTIEMYGALPFNQTFDATVEWVCADGLRLIDSARPNIPKGVAAWSNAEIPSSPTQAAIGQMNENFRTNRNEHGHIAPRIMKTIIIPPQLNDTVAPIISTDKKPGSTLNDDNYLTRYGLEVKVWNYLENPTAWFGMGAKDVNHELIWLWGVKPNIIEYNTGNPDVMSFRGRMVFQSGANRPYNVRGNSG